MILIYVLVAALIAGWLIFRPSKLAPVPMNDDKAKLYRQLLEKKVEYYEKLSPEEQERFLQMVLQFLETVHIEGVGCNVSDTDKVLVASSAVIPIFGFNEWRYRNLGTVLLYPDTFNHEFQYAKGDRNILGMVGEGAMNRQMILSKQALEQGFKKGGKSNTGIHEFVHLLDKSDGSTDGIPENLLQHSYTIPWLKAMHEEIRDIKKGQSDIDPYATTNDAEFLAVAAEYFFEKPQQFKTKHPELYELLEKVFRQSPE